MKMDKQLLIIIIFLAVTFSLAGILVMGAVPKIFQTGEQVNQTQASLNQTQLFIMQTQHEDQARENQSNKINRETNKSINDLENRLYDFMNLSAKRSEIGAQERQIIINQLQNQTKQIYELLQTADNRNYEVNTMNLKILGNLTKELKEIKSLHKEIMEGLKTFN
jgi:hypothetical protein